MHSKCQCHCQCECAAPSSLVSVATYYYHPTSPRITDGDTKKHRNHARTAVFTQMIPLADDSPSRKKRKTTDMFAHFGLNSLFSPFTICRSGITDKRGRRRRGGGENNGWLVNGSLRKFRPLRTQKTREANGKNSRFDCPDCEEGSPFVPLTQKAKVGNDRPLFSSLLA